jgi:diguanylate cyclase (GGDEF)-like protein
MSPNFQQRIMLLLIGLVAAAQFPTFIAVTYAIQRNVLEGAQKQLELGLKVFSKVQASRSSQLRDTVRIAASDFGFREAVATGDVQTVHSVLINHGERINASFSLMVDSSGKTTASTTDLVQEGTRFPLDGMLRDAKRQNLVSGVIALNDRPFQIVLAPVRTPKPIGWVSMGFAIDQGLVDEFRDLSGLDVSVAVVNDIHSISLYSTLPATVQAELRQALLRTQPQQQTLDQPGYLSRVLPLDDGDRHHVYAVLQTSVDAALMPYAALKDSLVTIAMFSLFLSLIGAWLIARSVMHPVRTLVAAARRVEQGDYLDRVQTNRRDELGDLARVFNQMQSGISQRQALIAQQAFQDPLTGLPNRASVADALEKAIARAKQRRSQIAVMMLDVNRFKEINDTLGHPIGDRVLIGLAHRLRATIRSVDVVARLGGDEFLVVLDDVDPRIATALALELARAATQAMPLESLDLSPDLSIGIAIYPDHGENASDLIRRADIAMYDAKQARAPLSLYEPGRDAAHLRRFSLINELRRAVEHEELRVHYQPKIGLGDNSVTHVEALVRWQHPNLGLLPPDEFIPLAEHAGSIHLLTDWMLRTVIGQCRAWADVGLKLGVAVNLSALDIAMSTLPATIEGYLNEFGVPAARLLLEVTESTVMRDPNHAVDVLTRLKACGVKLAIDDFGMGFSSLAQLKRLPVDEIKIDKSFVMHMSEDSDDATIVRSTIELGHNMGLSVVAEGVQTDQALAMLQSYHCDMAQGFLISIPLPTEQITRWLIDCDGYYAGTQPLPAPEPSRC